jgi:diphosphoinositol-polyphosphate diphosphatase
MNEKSKGHPQQTPHHQGIPSKVIVETMVPAKHQQPVAPPPTGASHTPPQRKVKQAPVCRIPALRKEHMSAEQLSMHCFEKDVQDNVGASSIGAGVGSGFGAQNVHSFSPKEHDHNDNDDSPAGMQDPNHSLGSFLKPPSSLQRNVNDSNDAGNDTVTNNNDTTHTNHNNNNNNSNTVTVNPKAWEHFKKSILQRQESRTGRDRQRFATDPVSGELLRLVTGTVPIMKDGKILLVSSSSKPEWILPKGGWESDETCEVRYVYFCYYYSCSCCCCEPSDGVSLDIHYIIYLCVCSSPNSFETLLTYSALRETYEEGGILGTLGPRLKDIEFETRKGKKRRLELESLKKKVQIAYGATTGLTHGTLPSSVTAPSSSVSVSSNDRNSEACHSEDDIQQNINTLQQQQLQHNVSVQTSPHHKEHHDNESYGSVASVTSEHSSSANSVRMIMFPLYVLEVREHWPESGRARKVVDIDTAIQIMESRPEFQKVLLEVKEKGYHLMPRENEKLDVLNSTII